MGAISLKSVNRLINQMLNTNMQLVCTNEDLQAYSKTFGLLLAYTNFYSFCQTLLPKDNVKPLFSNNL